jgi:hypothetical protein
VRQRPELGIVAEADEVVGGQHLAVGQRQIAGIGDEAIDEEEDDEETRRHDELRARDPAIGCGCP